MELGTISNSTQATAPQPKTPEGAATPSSIAPPSPTPQQTANAVKPTAEVFNSEQIRHVAHSVADSLKSRVKDLQFAVSEEDSNRIVVQIIDPETKEVIRQIPGEEVLKLAKAIDMATGRLIRTTA